MLNMNLQFFAHKKGVGSTKNGRDSESKRLGAKRAALEDRAGRHNRKEAEVWAQKRKKTANFIETVRGAQTVGRETTNTAIAVVICTKITRVIPWLSLSL